MENAQPPHQESRASCRLLIADDNPINLKMAAYYLETLRIPFDTARNGREVLEALEKRSYDLILMDCLMPELDGYEATAMIRKHADAHIRGIPIIGVTSPARGNDETRCLEAGMSAYLPKPLRLATLQSHLHKWLPHLPGALPVSSDVTTLIDP